MESEREGAEMFLLLARSFLTKRQGEDAKGKVLEGHVVLWSVFVCVFCFVSFLVSLKGGGGDGEPRERKERGHG